MNAVGLYVSAARLVLQNNCRDFGSNSTALTANEQNVLDLFRLLPHLRQSLSCAVCTRMLCDPFQPKDSRCQHNVCRLCVRGRKQIRPVCSACKDCQDFKIYEENKQMRCLLLCYKSLCEHLVGSPLFQQICKQRAPPMCLSSGIAVPTMSAREFIMEGASYEDILSAFSIDLPRPKFAPAAVLPPISYSNSTASLVPISAAALPVPKAAATPSTPQQQYQLGNTFPVPMAIKQEPGSPPSAPSSTSISQSKTSSLTTATSAQTNKTLKKIVDLSSAVQLTASMASSSAIPQTVTYVSHAPAASVVVPLLSSSTSSTVTTAPLTIASAKLQSLSRQLAAQQQRNFINVSSSTLEMKPSTALRFKLASAPPPVAVTSIATASPSVGVTTTTATVTSQTVRNPPPIKTVSNGSAMYSVLYTGIGNKITIKRKTDGDDDGSQKRNFSTSTTTPNATTVFRQVSKTNAKRRGCRCGNATPTPGKLTCCGQRCPCYVDSKSCIGCKCRGCRNPHRPDGGKVRPVIPELACYEIQMADSDHSTLSPGELPIATSASSKPPAATTSISTNSNTLSTQQMNMPLENLITSTTQLQPQMPPTSRLTIAPTTSSTTTSTANVIPYRNLQKINAAQQQQQHQTHTTINAIGPQQQQQQPQTNMLHLESLQRESLLIQSAEGKYQVVNVFTTATSQHNHSSSGLQRIHTLPQLQTVGNSSNNVISNNNATFLIQSTSNGVGGSSVTNPMQHLHQIPEISTTLPQIIMQQSHTHQQQQQTQRAHLQQQLKNNVITVHPITSPVKQTAATIAPSAITLSPILVTSPNTTYTSTDMFSESSSEEYVNDVNVNSSTIQPTRTISASTAPHVSAAHVPPYVIATNSNNSSVVATGQPQYIELIESADM